MEMKMNLGFQSAIFCFVIMVLHLVTGHTGETFRHVVICTIVSLISGIIKHCYLKYKKVSGSDRMRRD